MNYVEHRDEAVRGGYDAMMRDVETIRITGPSEAGFEEILTPEALRFVAALERQFGEVRQDLLAARTARAARLAAGELPDFLAETAAVRQAEWQISPEPAALARRWVEITGPADRKMMINALNSGADVFMADFEDAFSPTWPNLIQGQRNLIDAIERKIEFHSPDGKTYRLSDQIATLFVRPRGWHLIEKQAMLQGKPVSASLFDFGLYFFHNARRLLGKDSTLYFYLPKLESHREARLWNDVFNFAQDSLDIPRGTVKATVLVETILAAFEMDEILYELRDHSAGLNAGRWDYIFSIIKKLGADPRSILPDRSQVTMAVPFMRAYTDLLVKTCHRRGAHAIGGMAAFIPSRKDPEVNRIALLKVREDKLRESSAGFDGTWVAHPDLVPVAHEVFEATMGGHANQLHRQRPDVIADTRALLDVSVPDGAITEHGVRQNVSVGIQYLESWLRGVGAAAINDLMEDAATAEISRSQLWQWRNHHCHVAEGAEITADYIRRIEREELGKLRQALGDQFELGKFVEAAALFEQVALSEDFVEFLTVPAYGLLD